MCQIKLKEIKNKTACLQIVCLIHTLTPGVGCKDQIFFLPNSSHVAYLINGNEA